MTVYLVELEPVETRYTSQWKKYLPEQMRSAGCDVVVIEGPKDAPQDTTPGAFLNFSGTNYWKSEQLKTIAQLFADGAVKDGDYFLYTDAWNPTVLQLKYMAQLLDVNIKIGGMWHAGAYDPNDFLGRLITHREQWVRHAELSMFYAFDHNFFATQDHVNLFQQSFPESVNHKSIEVVGWPMEYMEPLLEPYIQKVKGDLVLFPHRIAPEKQLAIFRDIAKEMADEADFIVCQEQQLTKDQYHELLGNAKVVFSANLQETLGISMYEGAVCGAAPMVPDRLSYTEMYSNEFKYPSEWTESWESYIANKQHVIDFLRNMLNNKLDTDKLTKNLEEFFYGRKLYSVIKGNNNE